MSTVTNSRVSEAEFLSLPESVERIELIDGEVIVSPSPLFWHQEVLGRLVFALRRWAEGRSGVTIAQAPLDVRFAPGRILQPDAMVFLATIYRQEPGPITRVPLEALRDAVTGAHSLDGYRRPTQVDVAETIAWLCRSGAVTGTVVQMPGPLPGAVTLDD